MWIVDSGCLNNVDRFSPQVEEIFAIPLGEAETGAPGLFICF